MALSKKPTKLSLQKQKEKKIKLRKEKAKILVKSKKKRTKLTTIAGLTKKPETAIAKRQKIADDIAKELLQKKPQKTKRTATKKRKKTRKIYHF